MSADTRAENAAVMTQEIPEAIERLQSAISDIEDYFNAGCDIDQWQQTQIHLAASELELFSKAIYNINS